MAFQSGEVIVGQSYYGVNSSDWNLLSGEGDPLRVYQVTITFPKTFAEIPRIQANLAGFYALGTEPKILVGVANPTAAGFDLQVSTWGNCRVQGCVVNWIAYNSASAL